MFEPILANYTPDGDDWTVKVTAAGKTLTATAPGLIAARDRADQLVDKLLPGDDVRTVVHTLDGDAFGFTEAYLSARLAKPADVPAAKPEAAGSAEPSEPAAPTAPTAPAAPAKTDKQATPAPKPAPPKPKPAPKPVTPAPRTASEEAPVTESTG